MANTSLLNPYSGHRFCWKHIVALHSQGKKITKREEDSIKERKLWGTFSEDKKASFAYLDSLCFNTYVQASCVEALPGTKDKVLKWVKQKQFFSKKYVLVIIVYWLSRTNTPGMLLLDSLEIADPKRSEPNIRKFVRDIYRQEGRFLSTKMVSQIPLSVPMVPQQRDDVRCGYYVLYLIDEFIKKAPENFSILEGYPYFMQHDWFTPEEVDKFCTDKLEK